jgi:O-antigen/teichoic acid export membrane protein
MAPLLPLRFLNNAYGMTLSALDRQGDRTRGVMVAAGFNVLVNLVVIPRWGALGTACTTLATELLLAAWFRWRVRPLLRGLGLPGTLARVGLASAGMGLVLVALPEMPVLASVATGAVAYLALGALTGALRRGDLGRLRGV